jgi:hypothetical protein
MSIMINQSKKTLNHKNYPPGEQVNMERSLRKENNVKVIHLDTS